MQPASKEYKRSMKERLRNHSYIRVTIGVINQMAQADCKVSSMEELTYFSNAVLPLDNYPVTGQYATLEEGYTRADGSMYFLPRSPDEVVLNAGMAARDIGGSLSFVFTKTFDIRGLTIDFGADYPVDFQVVTNAKTINVTGNTQQKVELEDILPDTTSITIVPLRMLSGQCRLRIHQITMGIGIYFDNRTILSSEKVEYISPISEELPAIDFTLKVDNHKQNFNIDNDSSVVNFLESGQEVEVLFGYELADGTTEWLPGTNLVLKEWEADGEVMNFTAIDRLDGLDGTYYRGRYYPEGISLYRLAEDVLMDAGLEGRNYQLDSYLRTVKVKNPLPVVSHKEALQLIANAGRCILYQDRRGLICIKAAFNITLSPKLTASSENAEFYSNTKSIVSAAQQVRYASYEESAVPADGGAYFLPRSGSYQNIGYVSEAISDGQGLFYSHPTVTIDLEAAIKYFGLHLSFVGNPPEEMVIHTYKDGELQESHLVSTGITTETKIEHEFPEADRYMLEFIKTKPYNRVSLSYMDFGEVTDYALEYRTDLSKSPKGRKAEQIKAVRVASTAFQPGAEQKELFKDKVVVYGGTCTVYFTNASHGYSASAGTIVSSSAYYVTVAMPDVADGTELELTVIGYEYTQTQSYAAKQINNSGTTKEWSNPLIDESLVGDIADWLGDYFYSNREYELTYRGEPRIDGNDVLFLESPYVENLKIRVYEHRLKFAQALSGSMKARRDMYVARTENQLVRSRLY